MASTLKRAAATGKIADGPVYLKSVALQAAAANATALLQDTTAGSGTDVLGLAALANGSAVWAAGDPDGVLFAKGLYLTLAGADAAVAVEYE